VSAASTTVTVTEGTPTSIMLTVSKTNPAPGTSITFLAKAIFPGNSTAQDITSSVTWNDSDPTNVPLIQGSGASNIPQTAQPESVTVFATFDNVNSNTVTIAIQ
jgi:hypothetical protein